MADQPDGIQNDQDAIDFSRVDGQTGSDTLTLDPVVVSDEDDEERPSVLPFPVVGIGASAGGLEAFTELLHTTPADAGMAYVVISHLPAHQKSLLAELLGRATSMPVQQANNDQKIEPNHVYIIPPNTRLTIQQGRLKLAPRPESDRSPRPVDIFFRSLAADQRSRAIGIVLSGTDSDGALGLQAIKGEGGISIAQEESTARFEEMPRNAIAMDHVDLVLSPSDIGIELGRIGYEFQRAAVDSNAAGVFANGVFVNQDPHLLSSIYSALRSVSGVDFGRYKQSTVQRRLARRMVIRKITALSDYAQILKSSREEAKELYEDILIGVTRFFRDPAAFQALKEVAFRAIMSARHGDAPIRIWTAGCSTGEETYSIAISLLEYLGTSAFETPIQIFGTDVSERAIERARLAAYPESLAGEISAERLRRFFVKTDRGYQIAKPIRELCVFAKHNLAQDPPFSRLDMISCRNVLIYLGASLQKTVIPAFHYALNYPGILMLGNSETIRDHSDLFSLMDRKHRFYGKIPGSSRVHLDLNPHLVVSDVPRAVLRAKFPPPDVGGEFDLLRAADRIVLLRHGPPGVIINESLEILQSRGDTSPYLSLPAGAATLNLLRMAREGLGLRLRDGVQRARADGIPVILDGVVVRNDESVLRISVEILPIPTAAAGRTFLVLFVPEPDPAVSAVQEHRIEAALAASPDEKDREIQQLRQDLASTKVYLQSLLEDRDANNQELISANEEIQSSNEELQSINEELETAKEELQSSNEELQSVNEELHTRNTELSQSTNDLMNLLNNITMPVLILDSDLRIRQFTPLAERVMNVRLADIGRSIGEIRLNLTIPDLEPLFREVIDSLTTRELEAQDRQGRWYLLRARPYRTSENRIDGVVMVLVDIDHIRRTTVELMEARDFATAVVESVQTPLAVLTADLHVRLANRAFLRLSGLPKEIVEGRSFPELADKIWDLRTLAPMLESLARQQVDSAGFALEHEWGENTQRVLLFNAHLISTEGAFGILIALEDATIRKQAQRMLRREKERLEGRVHVTEQALDLQKDELQRLTASLFKAQEMERRRVAGELHDDLSQKVAILEIGIEKLERMLPESESAIRTEMGELRKKAGELTEDLHRMARQLHPQVLDDLGLAVALKRLSTEFEARESIPVQFIVRSLPAMIPRDTAFCFYRITQEALRNISKHAGNAPVEIELEGGTDYLGLRIRDQGAGFRLEEKQHRGGLGFISMQERVRQIGGTLTIESTPGEGTSVTVNAPLAGREPD